MADNQQHPSDIFFNALAAGDFDKAYGVLTDDAVVWHNFDNKEQTVAENRAVLGRFYDVLQDWVYHVQSRDDFADGFVQRHRLTGAVGAARIDIPVCVVGRLREGKIARLDEYFDPAGLLPVRNALMNAAKS